MITVKCGLWNTPGASACMSMPQTYPCLLVLVIIKS